MRIALGSDERSHLTDYVEQELRRRGFEVELFGSLRDDTAGGLACAWPDVARDVGEQVASSQANEGILFCWTGTGVSIAANKIAGVRAALCADAETARGAKALSLRATSEPVVREVLDAWFSASADPSEEPNVDKLRQLDDRYQPAVSSVLGEKGRS